MGHFIHTIIVRQDVARIADRPTTINGASLRPLIADKEYSIWAHMRHSGGGAKKVPIRLYLASLMVEKGSSRRVD